MYPVQAPLSFNWETSKGCQESFATLLDVSRRSFGGDGSIGYAAFTNGMTYIPVPLANWLPAADYSLIRSTGVTQLRVTFIDGVTAATSVFAMIVSASSLTIDAGGGVNLGARPG